MQDQDDRLARRHFLVGWWLLLVFVALGTALEAFHGLKMGFYLDLGNATRRLMWTLAHAHGVLLGLVNIAFALTLQSRGMPGRARITSASLLGASVLLPGGFLLGGIVVYGGDPSLGVLLTPVGAVLLLVSAFLVVRSIGSGKPEPEGRPPRPAKRR